MASTYQPDFAVHPGEHLEELLDTVGMTQAELAMRLGIHKKTINEIIKGKASLSSDVALRLSKVFNYPAHLWNNLQRDYDETVARLAEQQRLKQNLGWLKQFPIKEMIKRKYIKSCKDPLAQLDEVLRFFGVAAPEQWQTVWETYQVAYRQSQTVAANKMAISVWLRQGENEAAALVTASYSPQKFLFLLDEIRALTALNLTEFQPQLIQRCTTVGVAVVFVPDLPKTGISGATRWVHGRPVLQLSLRYKSNDQFWFTFFHEAGHIVKHGKKDIFLEGNELDSDKEQEANIFARDHLIPPADYQHFLATWDGRSLTPITVFAEQIGIAPGIVVGRLQFDQHLPSAHGNKLKVFYKWNV